MATSKKRINVTLNPELEEVFFEEVAKRDTKNAKYFSHADVWNSVQAK